MTVRKQGAWSLWWLTIITLTVYYFVWYDRVNRELVAALGGNKVPPDGRWWSQIIPFYGLVALARLAGRLNAALADVGSPTRVGSTMTWLWAPLWYGSHTRYIQRRLNILHDIQASRMTTHV